jgi:argininosuccinate lyase
MVPSISARVDNMREAAREGHATATDLADYLVRKQVPIREAHAITGRVVRHALRQQKDLSGLSLEELQKFSRKITKDVYACLTLEGSVAARKHIGGTAPAQVRKAIQRGRRRLQQITESEDAAK